MTNIKRTVKTSYKDKKEPEFCKKKAENQESKRDVQKKSQILTFSPIDSIID